MNTIEFINGQPSQYDSLGEITWIAPMRCKHCGGLKKEEIGFHSGFYDGLKWQSPYCKKCGKDMEGVPKSEYERGIFLKKHPERRIPELEIHSNVFAQSKIMQRVLEKIPYPEQVKGVDFDSEPSAIRFRWRGDVFRVSDDLHVNSIESIFALGSNKAILLEALLKEGVR